MPKNKPFEIVKKLKAAFDYNIIHFITTDYYFKTFLNNVFILLFKSCINRFRKAKI